MPTRLSFTSVLFAALLQLASSAPTPSTDLHVRQLDGLPVGLPGALNLTDVNALNGALQNLAKLPPVPRQLSGATSDVVPIVEGLLPLPLPIVGSPSPASTIGSSTPAAGSSSPASPSLVRELEQRQGALTAADGVVGDVLNLTSSLRRDVVHPPRQLGGLIGVLGILGLGGEGAAAPASSSSTPGASTGTPSSPVSGLLRRQGALTSLDTVLADIEALAGAVRRDEVEFKLENGEKTVDMKYNLDSLSDEVNADDSEDCDDAGDAKECDEPDAEDADDEDEEDEDEDDMEDESDAEDEMTK